MSNDNIRLLAAACAMAFGLTGMIRPALLKDRPEDPGDPFHPRRIRIVSLLVFVWGIAALFAGDGPSAGLIP